MVGSEGALQGYRRVHDSAAFVPDGDNRQKGRPPRGVDDMGGVVLRKRGMWVVLGAGVWRASDLKTETEREAGNSSGGVNRGGGESRLVVQRDNTPSPRVQNDKRGVPLCAASPPSAFLPSHREDMLDMNLPEWTFRQRL